MWKTREEVKAMLEELGITQAEVARVLNRQSAYKVTPSELSNALSGTLTTPKANRLVADAYSYLVQMQRKTTNIR